MWSENEKNILNIILDQLIPKNSKRNIPSAGELGIASFIFDAANKNNNLKIRYIKLIFGSRLIFIIGQVVSKFVYLK